MKFWETFLRTKFYWKNKVEKSHLFCFIHFVFLLFFTCGTNRLLYNNSSVLFVKKLKNMGFHLLRLVEIFQLTFCFCKISEYSVALLLATFVSFLSGNIKLDSQVF